MERYKETWLLKYKNTPESAYGFPTCMYTMSLEAWRRGLEVKYKLKRSKSLIKGLSYSINNGKKEHSFNGSRGDLTTKKAIKICADKGLTNKYLKESNVSVPEGKDFPKEANNVEILEYAKSIGYPLVLKPSTGGGGGGVGVVTNILSEEEMRKNLIHLRNNLPQSSIIIERFFVGEDFRITVFDGKVIGAFHRRAQSVVGDGRRTIKELLRRKNNERGASPFLAGKKIRIDKKMKEFLKEQGKSPEDVPDKLERVYLRRNGEFFGQRDAVNATESLSPKMKNIAIEAVNAIPGLKLGGVDMLIDLKGNEGIVNEVNSLPQISNHLFPMEGNSVDVPKTIIDYYFPETKNDDLQNNHYYYDFKPIIENFRNGTASEVKIPSLPTGIRTAKQYTVSGENFNLTFIERLKKEAVGLIDGQIELIDDNLFRVIVSGKNKNVQKFQSILEQHPFKSVRIKNIQEEKYDGPIKIGIEIK